MKKGLLFFLSTFLIIFYTSGQQPPQLPQVLVRTINFAQDVEQTIPEATFKKLSNISGTIKDALQDITLQPDQSYPLTNIVFDNFSPLLQVENGKSIIDLIYDIAQGINTQNNRQEIKKRIAALSENQIVQLIQLAIYLDIEELSNQSMRAYVAKFAKQKADTFESADTFNAYIKTVQQTFTPAAQKELGQALILESPELISGLTGKFIKKQEPPVFTLGTADSRIAEVKFAPDSAKLVLVGKSIEIWDVPNKQLIKTIAREPGITVTALTWDPNQPILWINFSDGTLVQYDTNTYEKIKEEKLDIEINTIAFGPGATMPMLGLSDESMTEIKRGDKPKPPYPFVGATSIHITPSYIFLIDFHIQDAFYMIDRKTGKLDRIPFSENFTYVLKLAAGPTDNTLLIIGRREIITEEDETAEVDSLGLWDIQKKSFIWSRDFEAGAIDKFVFNKQLNMIATTISDDPDEEPENVQIWDGSSGEKITEFEIDDLIATIDWNVEGIYLAAGAPAIIYIWQMIPFKDDLKRLSLIHVQLLLYMLTNNVTQEGLPTHLRPIFEELPESIKSLFVQEQEEVAEPEEQEKEETAQLEEIIPTLGKRKRED